MAKPNGRGGWDLTDDDVAEIYGVNWGQERRRLVDHISYDPIACWLKDANRFAAGGNPGNGSGWWIRIVAYGTPEGHVIARQGDWIVRDGTEFRVETVVVFPPDVDL